MPANRTHPDEVSSFLHELRKSVIDSQKELDEAGAVCEAAARRLESILRSTSVCKEDLTEEVLARDAALATTRASLEEKVEAMSKAYAMLEREHCKYLDLFMAAPDAYAVTDMGGICSEANLAAEKLLHVVPGFLRGRPLIAFVARKDTHLFRTMLRELAMSSAERERLLTLRMRPRGEAVLPIRLQVSWLRSDRGKVVGLRWKLSPVQFAPIAANEGSVNFDVIERAADEVRGNGTRSG